MIILYISTFSLTTLVGAGAGMGMLQSSTSEEEATTVGVTVMQGIATGSLLYVVFFEIIEKERASQPSHHVQLIVIMLGSATIIALKIVEDVVTSTSMVVEDVMEDVVTSTSVVLEDVMISTSGP